jgi:hypothetical protein
MQLDNLDIESFLRYYPGRCMECPAMLSEDYGARSGKCASCERLASLTKLVRPGA